MRRNARLAHWPFRGAHACPSFPLLEFVLAGTRPPLVLRSAAHDLASPPRGAGDGPHRRGIVEYEFADWGICWGIRQNLYDAKHLKIRNNHCSIEIPPYPPAMTRTSTASTGSFIAAIPASNGLRLPGRPMALTGATAPDKGDRMVIRATSWRHGWPARAAVLVWAFLLVLHGAFSLAMAAVAVTHLTQLLTQPVGKGDCHRGPATLGDLDQGDHHAASGSPDVLHQQDQLPRLGQLPDCCTAATAFVLPTTNEVSMRSPPRMRGVPPRYSTVLRGITPESPSEPPRTTDQV